MCSSFVAHFVAHFRFLQYRGDLQQALEMQKVMDIASRANQAWSHEDLAKETALEEAQEQAAAAASQASQSASQQEDLQQQTLQQNSARRAASEGARRQLREADHERLHSNRLRAMAAGADDRSRDSVLQDAEVHFMC